MSNDHVHPVFATLFDSLAISPEQRMKLRGMEAEYRNGVRADMAQQAADETRKADQADRLDADLTRAEIDHDNRMEAAPARRAGVVAFTPKPRPKLAPFEPVPLLWLGTSEYGVMYTLCLEHGEGYLAYRSTRGGKPVYRTEHSRQTYAEAYADMNDWFAEDHAAATGDVA